MGTASSSPRSKNFKIAPENSRGGLFSRFSMRRKQEPPKQTYVRTSNGCVIDEEADLRMDNNGIEKVHSAPPRKDDKYPHQEEQDATFKLSKGGGSRRKRSWKGRKSVMKSDEPKLFASIDEDALINMHELHNILNDGSLSPFIHDPGNILLIDIRDKHSFHKHHIVTAKHISSFSDQQLSSGYGLAQYMVCVLYDNEAGNNNTAQIDVIKLRDQLSNVISSEVYVLRESYDMFCANYRFMCTEKLVETAWERKSLITYPSVIIDDKLYQGRGDQATNDHVITNLKITHIVNISTEHANRFERKVIYLRLQLEDVSSSNVLKHFEETSDFIQSAIGSGGRVLVHCNLGVSRSSAVSLAFLMKYNQWALDKAYEYLKGRRSCAYPNRGFMKQLSDWEASVLGERRTNIDYL